jgi:hypothetical protein
LRDASDGIQTSAGWIPNGASVRASFLGAAFDGLTSSWRESDHQGAEILTRDL